MEAKTRMTNWIVETLLQGYPGKSNTHGGLGWSTVALARGPEGRIAVLDTGGFGARRILLARLAAAGVQPDQVTDLLLTHLHYDHCMNFPLFPRAAIHTGRDEMAWALSLGDGHPLVPEHTVRALSAHPRLHLVAEGEEVLPGITCFDTPGHTPHHLCFLLEGAPPVFFAADAAKNRAELATGRQDITLDPASSARSVARVNEIWRSRPGMLLLPGHDLSLLLDAADRPTPLGERACAIEAWFTDSLDEPTRFDLAQQ